MKTTKAAPLIHAADYCLGGEWSITWSMSTGDAEAVTSLAMVTIDFLSDEAYIAWIAPPPPAEVEESLERHLIDLESERRIAGGARWAGRR